jgi:hypothetical protein
MEGVRWANQATRDAFEALITQPEAIHVPYAPQECEPEQEFADRLRTVVAALIRAVDEFGIDGPIQAWLRRVDDWSAVAWEQLAALLSDRARSEASSCPANRGAAIAA